MTFTFEKFLSNGGVYVALQRVTGTATVAQDGQTQAGPATATFFAPNGTPLGAPLSGRGIREPPEPVTGRGHGTGRPTPIGRPGRPWTAPRTSRCYRAGGPP